jgi:uncharacterized protein (DUF1499 family)
MTITSCPNTPNCVSSVDTDIRHFVKPLQFSGNARQAQDKLLKILGMLRGARITMCEKNFIKAEFTSTFFRFVDDVEFHLDDNRKIIDVKSSSRVGFSDLGVNRRRIEKIRNMFEV